jgi:predicted peptidase
VYVPPTYVKSKPSPLILMFHAAGKGASDTLQLLESQQPLLDAQRAIVLLPESEGPTWSLQMNG